MIYIQGAVLFNNLAHMLGPMSQRISSQPQMLKQLNGTANANKKEQITNIDDETTTPTTPTTSAGLKKKPLPKPYEY